MSRAPDYGKGGHSLKGTEGLWLEGGMSEEYSRAVTDRESQLPTSGLPLFRYLGGTASGVYPSIGSTSTTL